MKRTLQAFATAAMGFMTLANAEEVWDNGVLVLTDDNFDEAIAKYDYLLVEFYAPWCGHCKKLTPEYEAAAAVLSAQDPPRTIAKVDATENKAIGDRMAIQGFPTLYFFKNGERFPAKKAGRKEKMIVDWVNARSVSNSKAAKDCADMKRASKNQDGLISAYFGPLDDPLYQTHVQSSLDWGLSETWKFMHFDDASCAEEMGEAYPGISLFRFFDNESFKILTSVEHPDGEKELISVDTLKETLKTNDVPFVLHFNEEFIDTVMNQGKTSLVLLVNNVNKDMDYKFAKAFYQVASEMFGEELLFVVSGVSYGIQIRLGELLGVSADNKNLPQLFIMTPNAEQPPIKYKYNGPVVGLDTKQLREFINDFKDDKLKRFYKSQEIPKIITNPSELRTIVGGTWERDVLDPKMDVLVAYMATYCRECPELESVLKELAKDTPKDLLIGVFDGDHNEVEGLVRPRGYPSLKFYPKGNKDGVDYSGDRQVADFQQWLSEHSTAYQAFRPKNAGAAQDEL